MAEDDFSTGAELTLSVNDRSLSEARDTIESELGDLEVGVNAVVSGNRQQPRDPSSGQFMAIEGVEQRQVNTNETLDGLVQIENERWELDKYRNDYLEQLADGPGMVQRGTQQTTGGGGGLLEALGLRSILSGGASTAAAAGGIMAGGGLLGSFLQGQAQQRLPSGATTTTDKVVSGTSVTQSDLKASRQLNQTLKQFMSRNTDKMVSGTSVSRSQVEGPKISEMEWPPLPDLASQSAWPPLPDLASQSAWPPLPDLASQSAWPPLPDLTSTFEWPEPPEKKWDPFGIRDQKQNPMQGVNTGGLLQRGGQQGTPNVEPTINLGGITVDVTTTIDNAVDDAVDEVEDTVDREVGELERRVADAIGGFF